MADIPQQYATIYPWLGTLPGWVPEVDQIRIAAYQRYEDIFWSSEEGFEEVLRGDNENPVFMPTARMVCKTLNRYTAPDFGWRVEPLMAVEEGGEADSTAVTVAQLAFDQLFAREAFLSKFYSAKLRGCRKGDWIFHVIADDTKPIGRRLKIMTVVPEAYFPVYEDDILEDGSGDSEKLVKVHLAEPIVINKKEFVSRLTYERLFDAGGNQTGIQVSHGIFDTKDWALGKSTPKTWVIQPRLLDSMIPAIPVYHIKNGDATERFGSSSLRGNESVFLAINQTVSDEDMTLALEGIGVYATDGGPPLDEAGNEVDWIMGPGRFLTNATGLRRITGASSVTPYGDHYNRLLDAVKMAEGISDVAAGRVDSATAESGVALMIQLSPILSYTDEQDKHILDVMRQFFYDLCFWLQVYEEIPLIGQGEGGPAPTVRVQPTIGNKLPKNNREVINNVVALRSLVPPIISKATSHKMLADAGIPIADDELAQLEAEASAEADALLGTTPIDDTTVDTRADEELAL
jgi:hypothetical protein